jgi:hypothetical protein
VRLSWRSGRTAYFFEREGLPVRRERDALPDLREEPLEVRERDELPDLRPVRPLAEVRPRDLAPALRVLRAGFARREVLLDEEELFDEDVRFDEVLFDEPFVSPACRRCLLTTRAASCSARPSLAPRLRADCLIFAYCR